MNLEEKINGIVDECKKFISFSFSSETGIDFESFKREISKRIDEYVDERRTELSTKVLLMCETEFLALTETNEKTWDSRNHLTKKKSLK